MSEETHVHPLVRRLDELETWVNVLSKQLADLGVAIEGLRSGGGATASAPTSRVRVNLTQSAKGEWRIGDLTVEISGIANPYDPVRGLSTLIEETHDVAQRRVDELNSTDGSVL